MKNIITIVLMALMLVGIAGFAIADPNVNSTDIPGYEFKVKINPQEQKVDIGEKAKFVLSIKDGHPQAVCSEENATPVVACAIAGYTYTISVANPDGLSFENLPSSISLAGGEEKQIIFYASSDVKGKYKFGIALSSADSNGVDQAILFVGQNNEQTSSTGSSGSGSSKNALFDGTGFIVSNDESEAHNIRIVLIRNAENSGNIIGKMSIDNNAYQLSGSIDANGNLTFLFDWEGAAVVGFAGTLKKYDTISLLKGDFVFAKSYKLYASSQSQNANIVMPYLMSKTKTDVMMRETVTIAPTISGTSIDKADVYIQPTEIYKKKILGFIPNPWGNEVVEIRVISSGEVSTTSIEKGKTKEIQGYDVTPTIFENNTVSLEISKKEA